MSARALVVWVALGAGCAPFYRHDELRAQRSSDSDERARLRSAGDWEALAPQDPDVFLELARARLLAGHRAEARTAARYGVEQPGLSKQVLRDLRNLLAQLDAEDGLFEAALSALPANGQKEVLQVPSLATELTTLLEAVRLAHEGKKEEALGAWGVFVERHGFIDHPRLLAWSRLALAGNQPLFARLQEDLNAPSPADALAAAATLYRAGEPVDLAAICARAGPVAPTAEALEAGRKGLEAVEHDELGAALRGWRRAVALAPWWPEAHWNLALLLAQVEQYAAAARHGRLFVALSTDTARSARGRELASRWEQLASSAGMTLRAQAAGEESSSAADRAAARAWRERGVSFLVAGGLALVASLTFARLGANQNALIQAGGFATAADIQAAANVGQAWNGNALGLASLGGGLALVGLPMILFNVDPASPPAPALGFSGVLP